MMKSVTWEYKIIIAASFVGFILFTNMAILNLVTAIIVENVMDISREVQMDELNKEEDERKQQIQYNSAQTYQLTTT